MDPLIKSLILKREIYTKKRIDKTSIILNILQQPERDTETNRLNTS